MERVSIFDINEDTASDVFFSATQGLKAQLDAGAPRADIIATADTVIRANDMLKAQTAQDAALDDERVAALIGVRGPFEEQIGLDWHRDMELNILMT